MLAPSFVISFTGLIYPERNVLFWLAILVLCLAGYSKTRAPVYFVGCLVATHFALYYKETVVVLIAAYAVTRVLVDICIGRGADRSWKEVARRNALPLGMLIVSAIYAVLFLVAMLPERNLSYLEEHREALSSVFLAYAHIDWLPLILLVVLIIRFQQIVLSDSQLDPMWDSLAVGALAYFAAIISLRLISSYYMAPVDLIALLCLARLSLIWLQEPVKGRVYVVAILFICVLLQEVAYSSFRMVERKTIITTKSEFADFLESYLPTVNSNTVELFFPYASGYHLMELSTYLRYRGFHLAGQSVSASESGPRLVLEGREKFPDNRCVEYRDYACIHEQSAGAGALIVVFPDDIASMNDVEDIGKDSTLLLSVKAPGICARKWFRSLHTISPEFSVSQLPEHWLQLDVFKNALSLSASGFLQPAVAGTSGQDVPFVQTR